VELLADSDKFPEDWLFKHRWSKGKKNQSSALPNGNKIVFLKVGGRTSAVVPAVQKKTGPVAKDITDEDVEDEETNGVSNGGKRKRGPVKKEDPEEDDITGPKRTVSKKSRTSGTKSAVKKEETALSQDQSTGRRRSARHAK
jgi:formamidopyrimidine-DNA glycosylase